MDEALGELFKRVERAYDIPLNVAVWISFKPIIKIYLSIGAGFLLAKKGLLTPELSKGISRLILVVLLPCLIFNNIVSQIKDTDIEIFGVVIFSGFIYYVVGLGWGLIVYCISPIPRAWFGGLLLCCMLNNCSDLPLAYVQTIGNSPLLPSDVALRGVSYCVLMVIVFTIFTFNLGGTRLVEWDATRVDPHREEPTVPYVSWQSIVNFFRRLRGKPTAKDTPSKSNNSSASEDTAKQSPEPQGDGNTERHSDEQHVSYSEGDHERYLNRTTTSATTQSQMRARQERPFGSTEVYYARTPRGSVVSDTGFVDAPSELNAHANSPVAYENLAVHLARSRSRNTTGPDGNSVSAGPSNAQAPTGQPSPSSENAPAQPDTPSPSSPQGDVEKATPPQEKQSAFGRGWGRFKARWFKFKEKNAVTTYCCNFMEDLFLPQMIALISGITVCMIPWVRRVFVKGQNIKHFHDAPDHMPPLSWFMDFMQFFAGAQVPLGLMLLGATIASLRVGKMVPGFWKSLILIVVFKLALLPIIGCAWIHRIRAAGWVSKNDPIVPIVLAVGSGTPSATVQIYLTLAWIDPTKDSVELDCLALSLLCQYALLPITMTFLMTYVVMHFV